jgi:hypothetical protein
MNLQKGDVVKVRALGERILTRRLVEVRGHTALICNNEEYQKALKEKRQPTCIGFPLEAIVEVVEESHARLAS